MDSVPNLQDAFVGPEIVLHLSEDQPLDVAKFEAALKEHKVKLEGEPESKPGYIL